MSSVRTHYLLTIILSLSFIAHCSFGQSSNTSSPYSRYGVGDLIGKGFAQGFALGGTHIALQNDSTFIFFINNGNPASYVNTSLTTAELGLNYSIVELQNAKTKNIAPNAALAYVSMAFPVKKWWGSSIGLIPFSTVGYSISDHHDLASAGDIEYRYEGSGGINQAYWGNSIKPLYGLPETFLKSERFQRLKAAKDTNRIKQILNARKRAQGLSLGMNVSYLFGNIQNSKRSIFATSSTPFLNTRSLTSSRISDIFLDYGLQYGFSIDTLHGKRLKDNIKIMVGATFSAQTNVNARLDTLSYSYYYGSSGDEVLKDTIRLSTDSKGKITFPLSFGFGLGFRKGEKWLAVTDFAIQNWSSYRAFNQSQDLKNSMRISAGVQYIPNPRHVPKRQMEGYYKHIQYRIGARYGKTALELKNTQLNEYALTIGAGLPVGKDYRLANFSMVNVGLEFGERGTISNGLIRERFMKVSVGFTINDRWFVKPKID
ncbi:MAG TPA: hypothetical protein VFF27_01955 [Bacteroidia bacterium]|nr:hypothetical protein [Bacteroidia bacterium]